MFPLPQQDYTVMIVTATYNHVRYIEDTLKGIVMQQTIFPFVACVLDDCSTDGTAEIVRRYEALYPNIIKGFYFKENQFSQGKTTKEVLIHWLNKVKYIASCEGDDYWTDPLKLQKQVDFMDNHPECTLIFHNAIEHWEDGRRPDALFSHIENREYSGIEIFENIIVPTASCMVNAMVFNRDDLFMKLKDKSFIYHDIVLSLYCGMLGKIYGMEDVMCVYRRNANSITLKEEPDIHQSIENLKKYCNHSKALKDHFGTFYGENFVEAGNKFLFNWILKGMLLSLKIFDVNSYWYFFRKGLSESIILTMKTQLKMLYHIVRFAFK